MAEVVGLELRNVVANYPFERSLRFPGIQPNSGHRDYSRLSCGVAETQLGPMPGSQQGSLRVRSSLPRSQQACLRECSACKEGRCLHYRRDRADPLRYHADCMTKGSVCRSTPIDNTREQMQRFFLIINCFNKLALGGQLVESSLSGK